MARRPSRRTLRDAILRRLGALRALRDRRMIRNYPYIRRHVLHFLRGGFLGAAWNALNNYMTSVPRLDQEVRTLQEVPMLPGTSQWPPLGTLVLWLIGALIT